MPKNVLMYATAASPKFVLEEGKVYQVEDKFAAEMAAADPPSCKILSNVEVRELEKKPLKPRKPDPDDEHNGTRPGTVAKPNAKPKSADEEIDLDDDNADEPADVVLK